MLFEDFYKKFFFLEDKLFYWNILVSVWTIIIVKVKLYLYIFPKASIYKLIEAFQSVNRFTQHNIYVYYTLLFAVIHILKIIEIPRQFKVSHFSFLEAPWFLSSHQQTYYNVLVFHVQYLLLKLPKHFRRL